jgi:large subunit ribosomal protein L10
MRGSFLLVSGLVLLVCLVSTMAFITPSLSSSSVSRATRLEAAPSGYASTREGKNERIENYQKWLDGTQFVFAVPSTELTVKQVNELKSAMPEGTDIHVVKNRLMRRAIENSQWEIMSPQLEGPAMWFFVKDDLPGSLKAYKKVLKDNGKQDTHKPLYGQLENDLLDPEGVNAVMKLPTKVELYGRLANALLQPHKDIANALIFKQKDLAKVIHHGIGEGSSSQ